MASAGSYGNMSFNREAIRSKFMEFREQNPKKGAEWCIRQTADFMAEMTPAGTLMHLRRHHALKPYRYTTIRDWIHGHIGGRGRPVKSFGEDLVCPDGEHIVGPPVIPAPTPQETLPDLVLGTTIVAALHSLEAKVDKANRDAANRGLLLHQELQDARVEIRDLRTEVRDQVGDLVAVEVAGGNGRMRREASKRCPASVPLGHEHQARARPSPGGLRRSLEEPDLVASADWPRRCGNPTSLPGGGCRPLQEPTGSGG